MEPKQHFHVPFKLVQQCFRILADVSSVHGSIPMVGKVVENFPMQITLILRIEESSPLAGHSVFCHRGVRQMLQQAPQLDESVVPITAVQNPSVPSYGFFEVRSVVTLCQILSDISLEYPHAF